MAKKVKKVVLIVIGMLLTGVLIYSIPKIVSVLKLKNEAYELVKASTVNTFKESKTTLVYDTFGNELCKIKNNKDMYYCDFEDIPDIFAKAFVVIEDGDFYKHKGIDYKAIVRAAIANQKSNEIVQGGSTITQQLARNIFLSHEVTWERKIEEMFVAWELEKKYSKQQILEFYLNNIYFGNGYYGVESAAKGYFSKDLSELSISEQAFLAAIPNNPSLYDPVTHHDNTINRRNLILSKLYEEDHISSMDFYTAKDEQNELNLWHEADVNNSVVTYVRHCATESLMAQAGFTFRYNFGSQQDYEGYQVLYDTYFTRCQQQLLSGGYTIYTSINMEAQNYLQAAVDEKLGYDTLKSDDGIYKLQGAATCIDNLTGNVVAIVGSRSQDIGGLNLNRAYQSYRQPGSTIKPLVVYTPFLQLGNTPDTIVSDKRIPGGPSNSDGVYSGDITLREAVKYSKNVVAWNLYQEINPTTGIGFLTQMGFKNVWMDKEIASVPLGGFTYGVTTEEMAGAYAALANDGTYRRATCIVKIYDSSGAVAADEANRDVRVFDTESSRMMTDMLKSVMEPGGTGAGGNVPNCIVAGKTGTTNSVKDLWFCGYSRYYTTTVWMGYDYPKEMSGGNVAMSIFKEFMTHMHEGLKEVDFPKYSGTTGTQKETDEQLQESTEMQSEEMTSETNSQNAYTDEYMQQENSDTQNTSSGQEIKTTQNPQIDQDATTVTDPDASIDVDNG